MKILLATTNKAKCKRYSKLLSDLGYEVISLKDIDIKLNVDETGDNPVENALIKAKAYYEATEIPTVAQDDALYIDKFPADKQPGTHVRRFGGKELTDAEALEVYTSELKKVGGESRAVWDRGLAFIKGKDEIYTLSTKDETYFIAKPCEILREGYPLDSIGFNKKYNKYVIDLTAEEAEESYRGFYEDVREFFREHK